VYPLFICSFVSSSILMACLLIPKEAYYFSGPILGLASFIVLFVLMSRKMNAKLRPLFEQAQRQVQAGNMTQAIATFEKALAYKRWQLFLEQQVNTQIGTLHYAAGNDQKAIEFLHKGYAKSAEGPLVLGTLLYRQGKLDEAREVLQFAIRVNKKSRLLYNVLAWILNKEGLRDEAVAVLQSSLKPLKDDEDTKYNLERLQNKKKMNMKPFGQYWYMLKFERPAGQGQQGHFRKGFRQPPKRKKARKRK
jgi:tetratricopeptide (TPR) repeat protein